MGKDDKFCVKALYRRAQAELGLKNYLECMTDCKAIVNIDAQNREARALLKEAQVGQKEEDKKSKGLFTNMCKALGKGPIPEPAKTKRPYEDDMEESDNDTPMNEAGEVPVASDEAKVTEAPAKDVEMPDVGETKTPADAGA